MKLTAALVVVAVTLTGPPAWSQQHPKAEVSVDYTFLHFQAFDYESFNGKYEFGQAYNLDGGGGSFVYNFGPLVGLKAEFQGYASETRTVVVPPGNAFFPAGGSAGVEGNLFTYMFGPQFGKRHGILRPYGQALFGGAHSDVYSKAYSDLTFTQFGSAPSSNAFAMDFGAGLDIAVSQRFSIRPFEASYLYTRFNNHLSSENQHSTRFLGGVVFNMGLPNPVTPTMACAVQPSSVFPGDPVTATATAQNLSTQKNNSVIYSWTGTGLTENGTTANVATGSLDPGNYTVNATVKQGKKGKEGTKPGQTAQCSANFTVKAFEPPTLSCSASPTTIKPGDSSTITATGMSPQNRPLTYTYSAASGTINGNGTTAAFASTGAPTGNVAITCNVSDDKGHTASASTSVDILAPPPPPVPHAQALCSVSFGKDAKRPMRVDNEAKACLDQVVLSLQQQSDSKLVIVASSTSAEKAPSKHPKKGAVEDVAAQRSVNVKDYLVKEKGIDPSRINVATTTTEGQQAQDYLVPAGADFATDVPGTTPVDESTIKPQERKPLPERHHSH